MILKAKVLEVPSSDNGYKYKIADSDSKIYWLTTQEVPGTVKVNDFGTLTYLHSPSRGWWSFSL